jgi:CubicO group peptidase (beta-lactamase class C family)
VHPARLILPALVLAGLWAARAPAQADPFAPVKEALEAAVARKHVAGAVALVSRKGKVVFEAAVGQRDVEAGKPMTPDTIFRIASMTKPITSVAVMMLVEDGKLALDDPLSKFLPEFRDPKVLVGKRQADGKEVWETRKARREITVHDLLTHTSGITYRAFVNHPHLRALYVKAGIYDGISDTPGTQADNVKKLAGLPLLFDPGTRFEYGLNTDVLGRVIEVATGKTLDAFFRERVFEPLEMKDTSFIVPKEKRDRLAAVYTPDKAGLRRLGDKPVVNGSLVYSATYPTRDHSRFFSGGGGLCSTAGDYHRFARMMLNKGELDGKRLLKPETVTKMTTNRLGDIKARPFGYGFGVVAAPPKGPGMSAGSYLWGGFFYTLFWIDPKEEVIGVLMAQLHPDGKATLRQDFPPLVYAGLKKE